MYLYIFHFLIQSIVLLQVSILDFLPICSYKYSLSWNIIFLLQGPFDQWSVSRLQSSVAALPIVTILLWTASFCGQFLWPTSKFLWTLADKFQLYYKPVRICGHDAVLSLHSIIPDKFQFYYKPLWTCGYWRYIHTISDGYGHLRTSSS